MYFINIMQQSPYCDADSKLAGQEIIGMLWYPKIYYRGNKLEPVVHNPSHAIRVHIITPYLLKLQLIMFSHLSRFS
jgi:hypothetical protein